IEDIIEGTGASTSKLRSIAEIVGEDSLPEYVIQFIEQYSPFGANSIAIHKTNLIGKDYASADVDQIMRSRGFIGTSELEKPPFLDAIHHIKIFMNEAGKARVFYKYTPPVGNIRFIKNLASKR